MLWQRASIEQPCAHESHQICELVSVEKQRTCQPWIEPIEHWFQRSKPRTQIAVDACRGRVVGRRRFEDVQVMTYRVFETRERTVVEEGRLQRRVPQRRCSEPVAISRITGDLLESEILVSARTVEEPPWS